MIMLLACLMLLAAVARADLYYPQMIHISLTGKAGEMAVDWISSCPDNSSSVQYASNSAHKNASSAPAVDHASAYEDLKMLHTNYTLHYALMTGLEPGTMYYYKVGCKELSSEPLSFQSFPPRNREPIWAAYGDMGLGVDTWRELAPSIPVLDAEAQGGVYDGIIHAGDYVYDFAVDQGRLGDRFMNAIQPFASKVPYMGSVGNHECGGANRQHYSRRFAGFNYAATNSKAKPAGSFNSGDNLWYSWNAGLVHFVTVNTVSERFQPPLPVRTRRIRMAYLTGRGACLDTPAVQEVWNCPNMDPLKGMGSGNCVWNPTTNRSLAEEFMEWLEADLEAANEPSQVLTSTPSTPAVYP